MLPRLLFVLLCLAPTVLSARTWHVGPSERLSVPSEAAPLAQPSDTVLIAAGHYTNCAVWRIAGITIAAEEGAQVVITGPICQDKGLFLVVAPGIAIRGLTFLGARSRDSNGAGICAEGGDLSVHDARFEDNESGILTSFQAQAWRLLVEDSVFLRNGAMRFECAHGLYVGADSTSAANTTAGVCLAPAG